MRLIKLESRNLAKTKIIYDVIANPFVGDWCDLLIASNDVDGAVIAVRPAINATIPTDWSKIPSSQQHVIDALKTHISGYPQAFDDITIALDGTKFQRAIWHEISAIPYGETISYSELATRAGRPKAIRAAASACGRNPVPLIIPCHRIVGKNNSLGGFAWGLPYKKMLLGLES